MMKPEEADQVDNEFYQGMLEKFNDYLSVSLLNRRAQDAKEDPTEELIAVHMDIEEMEKQFQQCVEIAMFLNQKNCEMTDEYFNLDSQRKKDKSKFERNRSSAINLEQQVSDLKLKLADANDQYK